MTAQKIKKSEFDKFNKCKHIETTWVNIKKDALEAKDANVMLYAFGGKNFLRFKLNNFTSLVSKGAVITLLDEDGNTYDLEVADTAIPDKGAGAVSFIGSAKLGVDVLATGDLDRLGDKLINAIRINSADGYIDYNLKKDNAEKLKKAYILFKNELDK